MLKIGIIGCGKIADIHASQIKRISNCKIISVCDVEKLMAEQLAIRFNIANIFHKIEDFLGAEKPDIVHITTPPQTHFNIAKACLEAGCHIYVEKPFTVNTQEAEELINIANIKNLKITVGHDDQFTHAARAMRYLIKNGYLGGPPIHMESYYCYDLEEKSYAKSILGDKNHWVRSLPGKLAQNVISHGICRIAEYMNSNNFKVIAHGFTSQILKNLGEDEIIDELRVIIYDEYGITSYFTFSTQFKPKLKQFRVYGKENAIIMDHDQQTLICIRGERYPSYLERFIPNLSLSYKYAKNSITNMIHFIKNDFHMKAGMHFLINSFYNSVIDNSPLPIPYSEILITSKIMDEIFFQVNKQIVNKQKKY